MRVCGASKTPRLPPDARGFWGQDPVHPQNSADSRVTSPGRSGSYGEAVPRISFFYGISVYMYWNEAHHARPHFHARYAGQAASVDLDGNVIAGSLPPRAQALVAEWARLRRAELEANWQRARSDQGLEPVEPLP
jgi:hypothetical protein